MEHRSFGQNPDDSSMARILHAHSSETLGYYRASLTGRPKDVGKLEDACEGPARLLSNLAGSLLKVVRLMPGSYLPDCMILIIDNYDSFTYNLVQAIGGLEIGCDIKVVRNDEAAIDEIQAWDPMHIVISPGPCTPNESGISCDVIRRFAGRVPILGVCLGHQCIGQVFGGKVVRAERLMHGKTSPIHHVGTGIYDGLSNPFTATRYHSLTVDESTIPPDFEKTAWTDRGELMGIRHKSMRLEGVQFHPESYLTTEGSRLIANFLRP